MLRRGDIVRTRAGYEGGVIEIMNRGDLLTLGKWLFDCAKVKMKCGENFLNLLYNADTYKFIGTEVAHDASENYGLGTLPGVVSDFALVEVKTPKDLIGNADHIITTKENDVPMYNEHPNCGLELTPIKDEQVNHPKHYNTGKYEVIDVIEDWKLDFHIGNALKYLARAGIKDPSKHVQDLEKAKWYIDREIKLLKTVEHQLDLFKDGRKAETQTTEGTV